MERFPFRTKYSESETASEEPLSLAVFLMIIASMVLFQWWIQQSPLY